MPNDIIPFRDDEEWVSIVESIYDELDDYDIPYLVIKATEMLLAGYPMYKVAHEVGVGTKTIRTWLTRYPAMTAAISRGKPLLTKWRMAKLEQQFMTAIERNQEILTLPLSGAVGDDEGNISKVNPKVLTVVAAQTRYIIGLFAGQKSDVTVKHELGETVLAARKDALDYLAQEMKSQDQDSDVEPVETTFRVLDPKLDDQGPIFDETGEPFHGEMGTLDTDEEGSLCHICGNRFKVLSKHVGQSHVMTTEEYETIFLLEEGVLREAAKGDRSTEDI